MYEHNSLFKTSLFKTSQTLIEEIFKLRLLELECISESTFLPCTACRAMVDHCLGKVDIIFFEVNLESYLNKYLFIFGFMSCNLKNLLLMFLSRKDGLLNYTYFIVYF